MRRWLLTKWERDNLDDWVLDIIYKVRIRDCWFVGCFAIAIILIVIFTNH